MLGEVDLNKNLSKKEYKEMMDVLAPKFSALQREARKKGLPVIQFPSIETQIGNCISIFLKLKKHNH